MPGSRPRFPLRVGLRLARVTLRTTRDVADLGLVALDFAGRALGEREPEPDPPFAARPRPAPAPPPPPRPSTVGDPAPGAPIVGSVAALDDEAVVDVPDAVVSVSDLGLAPDHVDEEIELVDEVADPGAEDGAGAAVRIAPPLPGYDALRAPDVIAVVAGADAATLAAIELYEQTHRARRTVLDAVARASRRLG